MARRVRDTAADVAQPQCLINFDNDENGFYWHHRILLVRGKEPGQWVWLTPDFSVQVGRLSDHRVIPLARLVPIPDSVGDSGYLFDPVLDPGELATAMMRAKALADMMGFDVDDSSEVAERWYISDPREDTFGDEVPRNALQNDGLMVRRGDVALVALTKSDGQTQWVTAIRRRGNETFQSYREDIADGQGRDPRVLGDVRNADGRRFMDFSAAAQRLNEQVLVGFPLAGPRAVKQFVTALRSCNQSFTSHHEAFIRRSGLAERSETLRLACEFDQIDISNCASFEYCIRRITQIESAVRRNPRQPDFEGLDSILDSAVDEIGAAIMPEFSKYVGERQSDEAKTLKAGRQWREERDAVNKRREKGDRV